MLTRKQKKAIAIANEHNELKTKFIQNISAQMEPTLDTLDSQLPGVQALRTFSGHIQELSELENSLSEPYEVQEQNISTFCESVMDKIRSKVQEDVVLTVNAPQTECKNQFRASGTHPATFAGEFRRIHSGRRKDMVGFQKTRCPYTSVHHQ